MMSSDAALSLLDLFPPQVNEYYDLGRVTEFRYCHKIKECVGNFGSLGGWGGGGDYGWGMADNDHALIFVDNHDNQRGHGGGGQIITHKQPHDYRLATAFTLAWNYGFTRWVTRTTGLPGG